MKTKLITSVILTLIATSVYAKPIHINPYEPTPCSGSWDGAGKSACELLDAYGSVITSGFNFTQYYVKYEMYEITARFENNSLTKSGSSFTYTNEYDTFNTDTHPKQFAIWADDEKPNVLYLGVEDLINPSDYDYNDFVVMLEREPNESVPEPTSLMLIGLSILSIAKRYRNVRA